MMNRAVDILRNTDWSFMEDRNQSFWKLLKRTFAKIDYQIPQDRTVEILNLACGECEESRALCAFFSSGVYHFPSRQAHMVGIDYNAHSIQTAKMLVKMSAHTTFDVPPNCEFIAGDATQLERYPNIPVKADVVLVRHQFATEDILKQQTIWVKIIKQAVERLREDGVLIFTSYREEENQVLLEFLKHFPCEVVLNEENPYKISIQDPKYPTVYYDKFITIVKHQK